MAKPLDQLSLFALPIGAPVTPEPTISGLHWYKPDGSPLTISLKNGGQLPARYEFQGVVWSRRGRMPWVIDCYQHDQHKRNREAAFAAIEADMLKRGYRRAEA
ncbi:MAG: hypothetical protein L3K52_05450 [Candidatus Thiothrix sulfatifontis]|nr:MAG: hypothetical protein L3K52_05450 [Candidatus Thiothrix sulfatifontis]